MAYYAHQATFDKGWTTPLLGSRSDVDFWQSSLSYCVNFNVLTHGGLRRRSGTQFIAEVADSSQKTRLLPFKFSEEQSYVLAFNGNKTLRFISERQQLVSDGAPYTIDHCYNASDLSSISYDQFNDVGYLAHKNYAPQKLKRLSDVNWSIENCEFTDGPYMDADDAETTLKPSGDGGIIIQSTESGGPSDAGWYQINLATPQVLDNYWLGAPDRDPGHAPNGWDLSGWDGSQWVVIDTVEGQRGWQIRQRYYFETQNKRAFTKYRISFFGTQNAYEGDNGIWTGGYGFHRYGADQIPTALTASSTNGINSGEGFKPSDVGRTIRIMGPSSKWMWVKIASYVSPTQVMVRLYGQKLLNLSPISLWRMGAFSEASGWPACVRLFNERLMWARTNSQPVTVFGSKQGQFEDYGVSDPKVETDGLAITLLSSNQNEILWLADDEDLVTGSAGQIRSVGPSDLNKSFSAINITQRKGPTSGATALDPLSIGGVTLYAGSGATKIRELVLGDQNRYVAPELSLIGEHLFKSGIVDWAFCERPDPQIYCAVGDGSLVSVAYDREQRIVGFARHEISGGAVESVAVVPSEDVGYDDLYMVVRRTINGQTKRYIEVLDRPFDGDIDRVEDAFHVDCGLQYSGVPIQTITSLGHLEGEAVIALADGNVVRGLIVTGGSVTLPYAASKISIGLSYRSRAVTQPLAGPQQDGSLFGRNRKIMGANVDVLSSGTIKVGAFGSGTWQPPIREQLMKTGDSLFGSAIELRTGFVPADLDSSWLDGDGKLIMETDEPLPLLIRSLVLQLESAP